MDNKFNIKTEKMNLRFKNYESMKRTLSFVDIERLKYKSTITGYILIYIWVFWLIITIKEGFGVLLILIAILCSCIILLFFSIITDIIIPDKLKEIYEKAFYVHGYVINEPLSLVEIIEEIFFKSEEIDDFLETIMSGVFLEKRECFKCKKEMNFNHYYKNSISEMSIQQLEKIWKSSHIQLFCCRCYKKKLLFKKWRERFTKVKTKYLKGSK